MIAPDVPIILTVGLMGAVGALWALPDGRGCPQCPHCDAERMARELEQAELQHDVEHKGMGFADGDPDLFICGDERCPRNEPATNQGARVDRPVSRGARARRLWSGPGPAGDL